MTSIITPLKLILLFDESGTPTLNIDNENDFFIGVSLIYKENDEPYLFQELNKTAGLSNKSAKKNNEFPISTSIILAEKISGLPFKINVQTLNLKEKELTAVLNEYWEIGNKARLGIRAKHEADVRERKIPQIIHSYILDMCFYNIIGDLIPSDPNPMLNIKPYIDSWSIPACDKENYLIKIIENITNSMKKIMAKLNMVGHLQIVPIELLVENKNEETTKRKRLIDSVTSIISKNFFNPDHKSYSKQPFEILQNKMQSNFKCTDATQFMISFCKSYIPEIKKEIEKQIK